MKNEEKEKKKLRCKTVIGIVARTSAAAAILRSMSIASLVGYSSFDFVANCAAGWARGGV
jgi:hypothetical protein